MLLSSDQGKSLHHSGGKQMNFYCLSASFTLQVTSKQRPTGNTTGPGHTASTWRGGALLPGLRDSRHSFAHTPLQAGTPRQPDGATSAQVSARCHQPTSSLPPWALGGPEPWPRTQASQAASKSSSFQGSPTAPPPSLPAVEGSTPPPQPAAP